jgi:hypothetical protein
MADGTLRTTNIADNLQWRMAWWGLTETNKGVLLTRYNATGDQNFSPPDEDAPSPDAWRVVHIVAGSWSEELRPTGMGLRYWVSMSVTEK